MLNSRRNRSALHSRPQARSADGIRDGYLGKPFDRVDGRSKVKGEARFTAEFDITDLAHAALVCSTIAKGTGHEHRHGRGEAATRASSR